MKEGRKEGRKEERKEGRKEGKNEGKKERRKEGSRCVLSMCVCVYPEEEKRYAAMA